MVPARTAHAVLVSLSLLAVVLLVWILLPFWVPFFVAAVLAGALWPWTHWLAKAIGGRQKVAAGVMTLSVVVAVIGPLSAFGAVLIPQIQSGFGWLRHTLRRDVIEGLVARAPAWLQPFVERAQDAIPTLLDRFYALTAAEGARAATFFGNLLSATGTFVLQTVIMLIALYFLLADGSRLVSWLNDAVPLKRGQVSELLREFRRVTVAVIVSTLAVGGLQSIIALGGYLVAGVPHTAFFAMLTFVFSLIPAVGATVVVVALGLVKLATGYTAAGVFLIAWGLGVVSLIDNVVKPIIIRGGIPIHGAIIFFALLGGLAAFGPIGFLVGPLAVAFLIAVVRMYQRDFGV